MAISTIYKTCIILVILFIIPACAGIIYRSPSYTGNLRPMSETAQLLLPGYSFILSFTEDVFKPIHCDAKIYSIDDVPLSSIFNKTPQIPQSYSSFKGAIDLLPGNHNILFKTIKGLCTVPATGPFDPAYVMYIEEDEFAQNVNYNFEAGKLYCSQLLVNHSILKEKKKGLVFDSEVAYSKPTFTASIVPCTLKNKNFPYKISE